MIGGERRSRPEDDKNVGLGVSVLCPRCGSTTRRIPRQLLDRVVNVLWDVKRFRCTNATCGWEGGVRVKPKHFPGGP
jgi:hypothetical protein